MERALVGLEWNAVVYLRSADGVVMVGGGGGFDHIDDEGPGFCL
jgi:hypothetical protein